jgi:hypothetical protein
MSIYSKLTKRGSYISRKLVITMPNQDKTGPEGQGPMTGRGMGPCGGGDARGRNVKKDNEARGMGMRRRAPRGQGRGARNVA